MAGGATLDTVYLFVPVRGADCALGLEAALAAGGDMWAARSAALSAQGRRVESIRGVQCGEILRVLMERDLLRIVGRSEELGRPFLYGTTRKFLQVFGLGRLEHLPPVDQIRNAVESSSRAA